MLDSEDASAKSYSRQESLKSVESKDTPDHGIVSPPAWRRREFEEPPLRMNEEDVKEGDALSRPYSGVSTVRDPFSETVTHPTDPVIIYGTDIDRSEISSNWVNPDMDLKSRDFMRKLS